MAKRILVVEDDTQAREALVSALRREGYEVMEASDGEEGLERIRRDKPDLVILDLILPRMDGLDVCRKAREITTIPIIMLTARDEEIDKVLGLEIGADDYITKPYSMRELLARIKANLRRWSEFAAPRSEEEDIVVGPIVIMPSKREVTRDGKRVYLTPKEFDLLYVLATNLDKVMPREALLSQVWGYEGIDTRSLDVHIGRLRAKLEDDPSNPKMILTVRSVGYRMVPPEE